MTQGRRLRRQRPRVRQRRWARAPSRANARLSTVAAPAAHTGALMPKPMENATPPSQVEKGWDPAMGARPLRRAIQRYIEDLLADFALRSELVPGATVMVDCAPGGEVVVSVQEFAHSE